LFRASGGARKGWNESDEGDARRASFVSWLQKQTEADGGTTFDWVEVQYGDDEHDTRVVNDSDANHRNPHGL
jgi:hypothetical protein